MSIYWYNERMPLSEEEAREVYQHLRLRVRETLNRPDWDADIVVALGWPDKMDEEEPDPRRLLVMYLRELEDRVFGQTRQAYETTLGQLGQFIETEDGGSVRDIVVTIPEIDQATLRLRGNISLGETAQADELFEQLAKFRLSIEHDLGLDLPIHRERDYDVEEEQDSPPEPPEIVG